MRRKRDIKYPKWFDKAYAQAKYYFVHTDFGGKEIRRNAFDDDWTKRNIYTLYENIAKRKNRHWNPFSYKLEWNDAGDCSNAKEVFLHMVATCLNSRFFSRCEYEYFKEGEDGEMYKVRNQEKHGMKFSGFWAFEDDKELNDAWEEIFQWFMDRPWCYLPGKDWEKNRMEQL